ncbi:MULTISPECIES: tripartite tricarboxylate transporter TctB family protein [unclassified Sulfitobacter]|uniref:tripartite tricarboxylate transporter TctB family protein n=1 Tax=unclassified Sulfitobacter TaxID=196795 RepID=UPI0023E229B8|nr:tripartite tricarboxylate transporter TctB family protein [Sulfitobacter sp. Ks41]MDF3363072.1 tripartite tricarboxylate transporter TctB family protein [Sulfitobacter sp. Ks41]
MTTRTRDLIFAAIALMLALAIAITAFGYPVGSSYFPRTLAVLMAVLAVFFGGRILMASDSDATRMPPVNLTALLATFGGIAAYVMVLRLLGYEIATFLFLFLLMFWLGAVGWLKSLILSVSFTALLNVIFFSLLGVPRPDALLL